MGKKVMDLAVTNVLIKNVNERNAEVYVVAFCVDDKAKSPEELLNRGVLSSIVEENINDGDPLTIGDGGIPCYVAKGAQMPSRVAWAIAVYESDGGVRDFGKALEQVAADNRFKALALGVAPLLGAGTTAAVLTGLATEIMGLVGKVMQFDKDDQLFLLQDYYDVDLHQQGPTTTRVVLRENENVRLQYKLTHIDRP